MGKATWFALCVLAVGACKGSLSLGDLTSKKPSSSSSSSSDDDDDDSPKKSGGGGKVTPPPEVGTLESGKAPPWCKGYEKSVTDSNQSWVKSGLERDGYTTGTLTYMAKAACDKNTDERREKVAEWADGFKKEFGATDKDFVEAMTLFINKEQADKLEEEQCADYKEKDPEASPEKKVQRSAEAWIFGCDSRVEGEVLYWFDKPDVTQLQRAAILSQCIHANEVKEKDIKGEFAMCMMDMKQLDRGKFEKELAGMQVNLYGRVMAILNFSEQKANSQLLLKKYADKGKKDEEWQRLFDAPEKGWKDWYAGYEANKAAYDALKDFDKKAAKGSKKALADCGGTLRKLWFEHVREAKKVKNLEAAQAIGTDAIGYPLMAAMMKCDAASERYLEVAAAQDLFMNKAKESRGPRYASYEATLAVLNEIRNDREKFPLERMYPDPPRMGHDTWYKAYEQTFNKIDYGQGTGQIKSIKKKGDMVKVEFKTVKWKEEEPYDCRDTRQIYRIAEDGHIEYYQKCKYKVVAKSSTLEAVDIPADFAEGLKPGQMLDLMINTKKGRIAIPKGVYKDKDKKKFLGTFGVVW